MAAIESDQPQHMEQKMAAEAAVAAPPAKGKKKLIVIAVVTVIAAGGAGAGWYVTQKPKGTEQAEAPAKKLPPVFVNFDPFTVNLADPSRMLQLGLVFEVENTAAAEDMKSQMPAIRSRILMLLTQKTVETLGTSEGKQLLAEELLAEARAPFGDKAESMIGKVHFSSMVIQ